MSSHTILFYVFVFVAGIGALALLFIRHLFHAALVLITVLLAIAALYVLAFAEFIAVTQILIYAGGILVLIIFAIMLTSKISDKPLAIEHSHVFSGVLASVSLLLLLLYLLSGNPFETSASSADLLNNNIPSVGIHLMTDYMLPFEIAGVLLLLCLVGAAVIASGKKVNSHDQ